MIKATELRIGNYDITVDGIVYNTKTHRIIKHTINDKGYPCVTLHINGKSKMFRVHRLLAEKFIPNPENKPCVNHKDRNRANFLLCNLEWVTHSENAIHSVNNGGRRNYRRDNSGIRNPNRILCEEEVLAILDLIKIGYTQKRIMKVFNISQTTVSRVANKLTWKHVALTGEELTIKNA